MKKTKLKLKRWVKDTLIVLAVMICGILLALVIKSSMDRLRDMARRCDEAKGYTCSYYEIRQYGLGK